MRLREFIRQHRAEIDATVEAQPGARRPTNDQERAEWIANEEGLYLWARREGVPI